MRVTPLPQVTMHIGEASREEFNDSLNEFNDSMNDSGLVATFGE